jgi:tetratricopeptide (TPR) repeat protein
MRKHGILGVKHNNIAPVALVLAIVQFLLCSGSTDVGRRLEVGKKMPEFSAADITGQPFDYKHGRNKTTIVAFLSATQKRSANAAADINKIVTRLAARAKDLDVIIVVYDSNTQSCFQPKQEQPVADYRVLRDKEYGLWGKFGIISIPTVIISDPNDTLACVKAGYAYDFFPFISTHLNNILGIAQDISLEDVDKVKTPTVDTGAAKAMRHLQMAKMMKKKGRLESAFQQAQKAQQLDPNCLEVALELGELLCQRGRGQTALEVIGRFEGSNRLEKARVSLLLGWARRQINQLDVAEKLLLEATTQDPKLSRGLFELGRVYQARGQFEKAMVSYRKALTQFFGEVEEKESFPRQQEQKLNTSKSADPQ